jgi:hypothetical protein
MRKREKNLKRKESGSGDEGKRWLYVGFFNEPGKLETATAHYLIGPSP